MKKVGLFAGLLFAALNVNATTALLNEVSKNAAASGKSASSEINSIASNTDSGLQTAGNTIEQAMSGLSNSIQKALSASASTQSEVAVTANKRFIEDLAKAEKIASENNMKFDLEMADKKVKVANSQFAPDDTKEEMVFIAEQLKNNKDSVPNLVKKLKLLESNGEGLSVLIPLANYRNEESTQDCAKASSNEGGCAQKKVIFPSAKLEQVYKECSKLKQEVMYARRKAVKKSLAAEKTRIALAKAMDKSNLEEEIINKFIEGKSISCTPNEMQLKLCGPETKEEYQKQLVEGIIIPNGDTSATNFMNPTGTRGASMLKDLATEEVLIAADYKSLLREEDGDKIGENAPRITDGTYRNSNQLKAAYTFKDNIVNRNLISNQDLSKRKLGTSSNFQSFFLARQASLSYADSVLTDQITSRTGSNLSDEENYVAIFSDNYNPQEPIKEKQSGASDLDKMKHDVFNSFHEVSGGSKENIENGGKLDELMIKSLLISAKLELEEYLQIEKLALGNAIEVSNEINSPENIDFIKKLRN